MFDLPPSKFNEKETEENETEGGIISEHTTPLPRIPELQSTRSVSQSEYEQPVLFKLNFQGVNGGNGDQIIVRENNDFVQVAYSFAKTHGLNTEAAKKVYRLIKQAYQ